jgi:SAM-dependent methyltransferase
LSGADRQATGPPPDAFRFGRNWQRYVDTYLDPDRERIAAESLHDLVGDVRGKAFLDIGCGSGLFSLSAYRAGAEQVVSFDVDPESVAATRSLRERAGSPVHWKVLHGSILDPGFVANQQAADIVYSWGVLHHTGDMYKAIANAAGLTRPGGTFAIAIYNRVTGRWLDSVRWWRIKRAYNRAPAVAQRAMELTYALSWFAAHVRDRQNPVRVIREYRQSRGMAFWTDIMDWLGGYPYEFATADEIRDFCEGSLGLRCKNVIEVGRLDTGNNQFVFTRPAGPDEESPLGR